jgi:sugar phosphate isomerase/epimerase
MRFGVATISLPDLEPAEAARAIAQNGFRGVEWRVKPSREAVPEIMPPHPFFVDHRATIPLSLDGAREAAGITRANGLALIGLSPYIALDDVATLEMAFEMAAEAGAPQVRLQAPRSSRTGLGYSELFTRFSAFLERVVAIAAESGVVGALEIHHKTICPSAGLAHRVLSRFDPQHIGAIYDLGNLVWEGYENHEIALELLGPYLRHVHIKNAAYTRRPGGRWEPIWTPLEEGVVDVPAVLDLLTTHGYDGWVSIEELSLDRSSEDALRHNAAQLREWGAMRSPAL